MAGHSAVNEEQDLAGRVKDAVRWSRQIGRKPTAQVTLGWILRRLAGRGHDMYVPPTMREMLASCEGNVLHTDADSLIVALGWRADEVAALHPAFEAIEQRLKARYPEVDAQLPFAGTWGVEQQTTFMLYALTRLLRPTTVVETGVGDGHSSFVILAALAENRHGVLHSFEVDPRSGPLVDDKSRWKLHLSGERDPEASFRDGIAALDGIDLFFHDSDHRYLPQMFEYETAWPAMKPGGVFASDDVDWSRAWIDFTRAAGRASHLMFDSAKVIGAVRVAD